MNPALIYKKGTLVSLIKRLPAQDQMNVPLGVDDTAVIVIWSNRQAEAWVEQMAKPVAKKKER
jgi:hypothetical protein